MSERGRRRQRFTRHTLRGEFTAAAASGRSPVVQAHPKRLVTMVIVEGPSVDDDHRITCYGALVVDLIEGDPRFALHHRLTCLDAERGHLFAGIRELSDDRHVVLASAHSFETFADHCHILLDGLAFLDVIEVDEMVLPTGFTAQCPGTVDGRDRLGVRPSRQLRGRSAGPGPIRQRACAGGVARLRQHQLRQARGPLAFRGLQGVACSGAGEVSTFLKWYLCRRWAGLSVRCCTGGTNRHTINHRFLQRKGIRVTYWIRSLALAAMVLPTLASAQIQQGVKPEIGVASQASIGDEILSEFRFRGLPGVILRGDIAANWGSAEAVNLPSGTALAIIREKKTKACQSRTNLGWVNCVIDMDSDGRFDRVSFNDVGGTKEIVPPVPYEREPVSIGVNPRYGEGDDFKRVYVFTGMVGNALTVSYREFNNDFARPAFTEALSIPLGPTFPQRVAIKGHVLEIIGVDGMGLSYRLEK